MDQQRVVDELGRAIVVRQPVTRIVSLVPSLTEWLFALGVGARMVGVTAFCVRPATGVAALPKLRGTKNPDRAAIVALAPDVVIAAKEENRERDVLALEAARIPVFVTDPCTVRGAIETLRRVAELVGAPEAAAPFLREFRAAIEQPHIRADRRVLVPIWRDPWITIGAGTYAHDLLQTCGAINVAAAKAGRYPHFALHEIAELAPDIIVLPSEPYAFGAADLRELRVVFSGPIVFADGELLTWYGPRMARAIAYFRAMFGLL